jgi:hypothetical protein
MFFVCAVHEKNVWGVVHANGITCILAKNHIASEFGQRYFLVKSGQQRMIVYRRGGGGLSIPCAEGGGMCFVSSASNEKRGHARHTHKVGV